METTLEKIRQTQKESWRKSSAGWKKWDEMTMGFLQPIGDEIIHRLIVNEDHYVLDVATGTGEPGLTIASKVQKGKVTGTDLSEEMLAIARENALKRGIDNFETTCCDASILPFDDHSFDAISCRLGFMFFPDMHLALAEMMRVLKPGGRIAAAVWHIPEKNGWISISMETMISLLELPPPAPGAPGLFRCAQNGLMSDLLRQAGFRNIDQKEVPGKLACGTFETYWNFITEVACPGAYSKAEEATKLQIKEKVLHSVSQQYPHPFLTLDSNALVISGEK